MPKREQNVFEWLDFIRIRPGMHLRNGSLHDLESLLGGYYGGLYVHGVIEQVPQMTRHFLDWLYHRTRWSCCQGWAVAIEEHHPMPKDALAAFFAFVDAYRNLKPTAICTVSLGPGHNPTGKRVVYGLAGRMEKPLRVDVMQYQPEPLHFLRLQYPDRTEYGDLLYTEAGDFRTSVRLCQEWVKDELRVPFSAWKPVAGKTSRTVRRSERHPDVSARSACQRDRR